MSQEYPLSNINSPVLRDTYAGRGNHAGGLRAVADAAIRHAIDSGQVVTKATYEKCRTAMLVAEQALMMAGYTRADDGTWIERRFA